MGIMGNIFKQSGSMSKKAMQNEFAGRIYPTGQGPSQEEIERHEAEMAAKKAMSETEKAKAKLSGETAEVLMGMARQTDEHREKINAIYTDPFKAYTVQECQSVIWNLEAWMFELAQALKTGRMQLRSDADTQAVVDYMANYLLVRGCNPINGFAKDLTTEDGRLMQGLSFRTVVPGVGVCTIHAVETSIDRTGRNPTWKVWFKANNEAGTTSPLTEELAEAVKILASKVHRYDCVKLAQKIVQSNIDVLNNIRPNSRTTVSRYLTDRLCIPAQVMNTQAYLGHMAKKLGRTSEGFIAQFGEGGGHHVQLRIPAEFWGDSRTIPAMIEVVLNFNCHGQCVDMRNLTIRCGHYKEGLAGGKWVPSYVPKDPTLSRTNIYIGLV